MALVSTAITFARTQAQTDSVGITDANGLIWANEALLDLRRRFIAEGVDAAQLQEAYRDGTANQGTYLWPTDMFWLKSLELNYTDSDSGNYIPAKQVDVANLPANKSFGWLRENASATNPLFDGRGDWYEIFPTPTGSHNLTQLIRIFYFLEPTEYSSVSDTISYPESLDYRTLGWRIVANYLRSLGKWDDAMGADAEYEKRITQLVATLRRESQQPLQAQPIQDNGWGY